MTHGYPRPQLRRPGAINLNGPWLFALDPDARWRDPAVVRWDRTIEVPFAPETPASGIAETGFFRACWYRRAVALQQPAPGLRALLHFGAVDYAASVWVNGHLAVTHEGGYSPFTADITGLLHPRGHERAGEQVIVVRAEDDPRDLAKPRGKQDWLLEPHSIWYPRTTGIWQTAWIEIVPDTRIGALRWSCDIDACAIGLDATIDGEPRDGLRLRVRLSEPAAHPRTAAEGAVVADDTYSVSGMHAPPGVRRTIRLPDPGMERERWLWRPGHPALIDARVELLDAHGRILDAVDSYTALREVTIDGDRLLLNGRPQRLRMVLDQGYWPETGLTAPDDDALRRDVELTKALGFNAARKHQKIEDPRYLYWADRLGLMVWEEMPSAYVFDERAVTRLTREWTAAIERDRSHPCIVGWVPFNESWGVPGIASSPQQRHYADAMYALTKALDPTRPVSTNDGWENPRTDLLSLHDYDQDPDSLGSRLGDRDALAELLAGGRVAGRPAMLGGQRLGDAPLLLSEFGGIAFAPETAEGAWGYSRVRSAEDLAALYARLLRAVRGVPHLAGFCYTQLTDTYQETNGLLYADRTPKVPIETIARATRGR